jgi:hypothetical protein
MKLSLLLDRLRTEKDFKVEERTNNEGIQQFIVWTKLPFPRHNHSEWYVFTLPHGITPEELEIESWQIDAMLRHLWMFQFEVEPLATQEEELDAVEKNTDDPSKEEF